MRQQTSKDRQGPPDRHARVFVLGSLNTDLFARVARHPRPGETILGRGGQTRAGGKGANQAAAAALAGADVRMIGAVGDDANAETALKILRRSGCDVSGVRVVPGPTGLALITVAGDGENSIIVVSGANAEVGGPELEELTEIGPGDVLVLQGEIPVAVAAEGAFRANDAGARVVLNLAPVVAYPPEVLRLADPLVVNEHEGAGALDILGVDAEGEPEAMVHTLIDHQVPSVAMTLGSAGAVIAAPAVSRVLPVAVPHVVDTTGAGDAFVGALAAALASGQSLPEAAERANRFAAEAVQREGAQDSYPDWRSTR